MPQPDNIGARSMLRSYLSSNPMQTLPKSLPFRQISLIDNTLLENFQVHLDFLFNNVIQTCSALISFNHMQNWSCQGQSKVPHYLLNVYNLE
jgi:hypothetical protein